MQSLTEVLGTEGTVFTWSSYENTQMRQFLTDVEDDAQADPEVLRRLEGLLKDRDGGWRQVDLHDDVVKRFYFHEAMKSQTSIKKVLPAVLKEDQPAANIDLLAQANLLERNDQGEITDPYLLLPGVKDGTQAMLAYDSMLYGPQSPDPSYAAAVANELRAYCQLDTLSMVLIYQYLQSKKPEVFPY
jgi:PleD family two-component response regulator